MPNEADPNNQVDPTQEPPSQEPPSQEPPPVNDPPAKDPGKDDGQKEPPVNDPPSQDPDPNAGGGNEKVADYEKKLQALIDEKKAFEEEMLQKFSELQSQNEKALKERDEVIDAEIKALPDEHRRVIETIGAEIEDKVQLHKIYRVIASSGMLQQNTVKPQMKGVAGERKPPEQPKTFKDAAKSVREELRLATRK